MLRVQAERKSLRFDATAAPDVGLVHLDRKLARPDPGQPAQQRREVHPEGGRVEARAFREGDDLVVEVEDTGSASRPSTWRASSRSSPGGRLVRAEVPGNRTRARARADHGGDARRERVGSLGAGGGIDVHLPLPRLRGGARDVDLPARAPSPRASPSRCPAATARAPGARVEDNEVSRKLARNVLRSRGFECSRRRPARRRSTSSPRSFPTSC